MLLPCAFIVLAALIHLIGPRIAQRVGLARENFLGKRVPASYGAIAFPETVMLVCALGFLGRIHWQEAWLWLGTMGAMWALGLVDDIFGSRDVGGFRGHFRKLLVEHKLTTGTVKAIGGGIVGIVAGWRLSGGDPVRWVAAALLIPLTANIMNLVDLRPGRAVAVFLLGIGVTYIWVGASLPAVWIAGVIGAVALLWGFSDSRGRAMMGDAGSNSLGAALGLAIATGTGIVAQFVAIAAIAAIHWYSEKHSISTLIERTSVLRAIDRCLGVR